MNEYVSCVQITDDESSRGCSVYELVKGLRIRIRIFELKAKQEIDEEQTNDRG